MLQKFGRPGGTAGVRLFAFAHAGGTASTYAPWARLLTPSIEVVGVELAGHGTRWMEAPGTDVAAMAREVASELEREEGWLKRPFGFYGHSLGAVVAYETARLLTEETGIAPLHLFVGAARAPHLPRLLPSISHLPEDEFLAAVQQRYGGIPAALLQEPELLEMILPAMRADFAAYEQYRHAAADALPVPITAFAGSRDPIVLPAAVAAWADHTSGPFLSHTLPGDHFFLTECRETVLGLIAQQLLRGTEPGKPTEGVQTVGRQGAGEGLPASTGRRA